MEIGLTTVSSTLLLIIPAHMTKETLKKETNFNDVIIRLIDVLYDLINTGNFIGVILLSVIIMSFYSLYKLPPENINTCLLGIGRFAISEQYYLFPLGAALIICAAGNVIQYKVYKAEIKRLTEHRKLLIHGIKSGELKTLAKHSSSRFDFDIDK